MAMTELFPYSDPGLPALVIGASGMDLVGRLGGELKFGTSNPAVIRRSHGGVARNVAENLSRLGHPVRLITVVGRDEAGEQILEHCAAAGVDTQAVIRTADYPTGFYLGVVDDHGTLDFAIDDMRLLEAITPHYLRLHEDLFKTSSMVFLDANLPAGTIRAAVTLARRARIPVCADPTSSTLAGRLTKLLPRLYLVTPNCKEASVLTGFSFEASERDVALEAARWLVNQGVRMALVALAEFGVVYATPETTGHISAIRTRISDPTGAGDAMTAAVLYALLNDYDLDDAIRLGVAAASKTLRYPGSVNPALSLESLYV